MRRAIAVVSTLLTLFAAVGGPLPPPARHERHPADRWEMDPATHDRLLSLAGLAGPDHVPDGMYTHLTKRVWWRLGEHTDPYPMVHESYFRFGADGSKLLTSHDTMRIDRRWGDTPIEDRWPWRYQEGPDGDDDRRPVPSEDPATLDRYWCGQDVAVKPCRRMPVQALDVVYDLFWAHCLTREQRAALWRWLADVPGLRDLGPTKDRAGRPGVGFAADEPSWRQVTLIVDPTDGWLLAAEERELGPPAPAVASYTLYLACTRTNSPDRPSR